MTKLSANRAAKEAGIAKKTLLEAIASQRMSADKNTKGHWEIDPAELFRVFPKTGGAGGSKTVSHPPPNTGENNALQVEVETLRQQIEATNIERDRERVQLSETIQDLRQRLDVEGEERRRLTTQLTDQRQSAPEQPKRRFFGLLAG